MPDRSRKKKSATLGADVKEYAAGIVEAAAEDVELTIEQAKDAAHRAAVALGRLGGLKGGKARAAKLSKKRRSEIAKKAGSARWTRRKPSK